MNSFGVKERQIENDSHVGAVFILDIFGKLSGCGGSGSLREAINHSVGRGHNQILLNLAKVSEIDSSCLSVLVECHHGMSRTGGQIKIVHLSQNLQELMSLTKLLTVFDVYKDESEAIDSFVPPPLELLEYRQTPLSETYHALHPPVWGALGMSVTFRPELMENRSHLERSFTVKELLPSGRVTLYGMPGEFLEKTFEPVHYARP